jgi:hypothetical protein
MWDLGFTAFGGPPVHFQILHRRFVEGKGFQGGSKWLDEQTVSSSSWMEVAMVFCVAEMDCVAREECWKASSRADENDLLIFRHPDCIHSKQKQLN